MYAVIGATGHIGQKLTEQLAAEGKKVKAIGRSKEKLAGLAAKGAEAAVGNVEDAVFLAKTFSGSEAVFVMIPPNLQAPDIRAYQEKVSQSICKAVSESGVKHVVNISSVGGQLSKGNGPIAGLHHQEERLKTITGLNVLNLRAGYFMENLLANVGLIKSMGIMGSPMRADLAMPMIATADIASHAAERMKKRNFSGHVVQDLLGQRDVSMQEAAGVFGKAIGKPDLKYVQFPYEDGQKAMVGMGMSQSMAAGFIEMIKGFNDGTIPKVPRTPANSTPTSIEDFAKVFAAAFKA